MHVKGGKFTLFLPRWRAVMPHNLPQTGDHPTQSATWFLFPFKQRFLEALVFRGGGWMRFFLNGDLIIWKKIYKTNTYTGPFCMFSLGSAPLPKDSWSRFQPPPLSTWRQTRRNQLQGSLRETNTWLGVLPLTWDMYHWGMSDITKGCFLELCVLARTFWKE